MNLAIALASLALLGGQPQEPNYFAPSLHEQLVCAPMMLPAAPLASMRVIGDNERKRRMFGTGDGIIIDAGRSLGVRTGQQYVVRRVVNDQFIGRTSPDQQRVSVHTAGWVTVVEVRDNVAVAQVTHACDGIIAGDYLEPFVDPVDPPAAAQGEPDYDHAGRIVMGDERRQMGSAGTLMVLDLGAANDVRPGQTATIFRTTVNGLGPVHQIARATVVSVRPESAVLRIDSSREAVYIGDRVAINRLTR